VQLNSIHFETLSSWCFIILLCKSTICLKDSHFLSQNLKYGQSSRFPRLNVMQEIGTNLFWVLEIKCQTDVEKILATLE